MIQVRVKAKSWNTGQVKCKSNWDSLKSTSGDDLNQWIEQNYVRFVDEYRACEIILECRLKIKAKFKTIYSPEVRKVTPGDMYREIDRVERYVREYFKSIVNIESE